MTTLADQILKHSLEKRCMMGQITQRTNADLRDTMTRAHRFVLDDRMSAFMGDLSTAVYKTAHKNLTLDSMRHSALLPHDITWVEWNGRVLRQRLVELGMSNTLRGEPLAPPEEIPHHWGILMERHPRIPTAIKLTEFLEGEIGPDPVPMPVSFVWNAADEPLPWKDVDHKSGMIAHGVLGYICPYIGQLPLDPKMPKSWKREVRLGDDREDWFITHEMTIETAGIIRYALSFLAALNDIPATYHKVMPTKKFYVRGQYKKFLDHTEVRLNLPIKRDTLRVARKLIAGIHRRAHMVREHWRLYERKQDVKCEHLWGAVDENNHSRCHRCTSWRTRIVEHQRGDASLGFVLHSYKVTHDAA